MARLSGAADTLGETRNRGRDQPFERRAGPFMTPVIVALYDDCGLAARGITQLVADGFTTDRVEVT